MVSVVNAFYSPLNNTHDVGYRHLLRPEPVELTSKSLRTSSKSIVVLVSSTN
jgi:hypothetical protein